MVDLKNNVEVKTNNGWDEALENESWIAPAIDIYETENDFVLAANMPGIQKNDIKIKLEENNLVLMGRINYCETVERNYVLKETEIGNYYRKFHLSDNIDNSKIDARFENGQLLVTLPKHEKVKPKIVEVK